MDGLTRAPDLFVLASKNSIRICTAVLVLALTLSLATPARADIAPPEQPPGTNPVPGNETTHVRMLSEEVVLDIQESTPSGSLGRALVTALFRMRNLGSVEERMQVRFPLTFWNGDSDGFFQYPEIKDVRAKVDGISTGTRRITTPNPRDSQDPPVPWAAFDVTFPVGADVTIEVDYTNEGFGEYPYVAYRYVLETGAGWEGTIGSADVVVKLPYEAGDQNVMLGETTGFSETTPGGVFSGNELRWHFDDLEPSRADNLEVSLVMPAAWQKVLDERTNVEKDPEDGEAWGRLGKAYKEAIELRKGMRQDGGGREMFALSQAAYQKSVELLPKDALWHLGYADLLWTHYYWHTHFTTSDTTELIQALSELKTSLELKPREQRTLDLLAEIAIEFPDAVQPATAVTHSWD